MILLIKDKRFHSTSIADRQLPFLDSCSAAGVAATVPEESLAADEATFISCPAAGCGVGVAARRRRRLSVSNEAQE